MQTYLIAGEAIVKLNNLDVVGAQTTLLVNFGGGLGSHIVANDFDATLFREGGWEICNHGLGWYT